MDNDGTFLARPYGVIRRIGPPDAPFPGVLVRVRDGGTAMLVPGEELADWPGWSADGDGHLLAPADIVRTSEGHDIQLPVCVETLDGFLGRRHAAHSPLGAGEAITVLVSLLRGSAQARRLGGRWIGGWWLDDGGRPVFAAGSGTDEIDDAARASIALLTASTPALESAVAEADRWLAGAHSTESELAEVESVLFALGAPAPLGTTSFGPTRARALSATGREGVSVDGSEPAPTHRWTDLVDAGVKEWASEAFTRLWRRARPSRTGATRPPQRRRAWLAAAGVAVVIVIGGMLWPTSPDRSAAENRGPSSRASEALTGRAGASTPTAAGRAAPDAGGDAAPTEPPPAGSTSTAADPTQTRPAPDDLAAATLALLGERRDCGGESECLTAVVEDPARVLESGAIDSDPAGLRAVLLDEFGGVAVLRIDRADATAPAQLIVIVRAGAGWLIRDVHDVASG